MSSPLHTDARLILLSELFATPYFCQDQMAAFFDLAAPFQSHPLLARFAALARAAPDL